MESGIVDENVTKAIIREQRNTSTGFMVPDVPCHSDIFINKQNG